MTGIIENNVRMLKLDKTNELKCKCGGGRTHIKVFNDDNGDRLWIEVVCKDCGSALFYNGA